MMRFCDTGWASLRAEGKKLCRHINVKNGRQAPYKDADVARYIPGLKIQLFCIICCLEFVYSTIEQMGWPTQKRKRNRIKCSER